MRWNDTSHEWKPFFCLVPRFIDGFWIWLETVEMRQVANDLMLGPSYSFRLRDRDATRSAETACRAPAPKGSQARAEGIAQTGEPS